MSIDDRVSVSQIQKAVKSLSTHAASKKKEIQESGKVLFDDEDENVWLVVTTKTMSPSLTLKPQRIPLAHPIIDPRISSICLITKDPQRAYKDLLQKHSINFISRVVGISKLKGKFSPYDARRQLAGEHGLFLADERVIPLLPRLLGKAFFKKKKQPIPVNLLKKDLKSELEAAISSTYMHQNAGTCLSIKIGHTGMDARKLLANVEKSIPTITRKLYAVNKRQKNGEKQKVAGKESTKTDEEKLKEREDAWDNIQSLGIKTHSSVCLPIWSCALNDRWVTATPTATASSKENGIPNGLPSQSQTVKSITKEEGEEDDDTMSEGESSEEEDRLSEKLAKSSLKSPVKAAKRPGEEPPANSRKQKKRKADHFAEDHGASANVPTKKSKKTLADSVSSSSHAAPSKRKEHATVVSSDPPSLSSSTPEKGVEKRKKSDRAKAVDFMEDDTPPAKVSQQPKKKEHALPVSSPFAAADAALKAHKKEKKRDKAPAATTTEPPALVSAKSLTSAPLAGVDASAKTHKKDKKREKVPAEPSTRAGTTKGTALLASVKAPGKPTSKPSETPSPTSPLKSALKKPSPPDSGLTPSELSEKKAKKATFSVVEKKKEKLGKGVIGGASGGKSGKGGKSKISLVGRGPKM